MGAGKKIIVKSGGKLNIAGSHLYSCSNMWKGIVVEAGGVLNITGEGNKSSFIEDADTAISYTFNIGDLKKFSAKFPLLITQNTIFNRNTTAIIICSKSQCTRNYRFFTITQSHNPWWFF